MSGDLDVCGSVFVRDALTSNKERAVPSFKETAHFLLLGRLYRGGRYN